MDGGQLRPLRSEEYDCLLMGLFQGYTKLNGQPPGPDEKALCPIELRLTAELALFSGMRKQSILTLAVGHIEELYAKLDQDDLPTVQLRSHGNQSGIVIDTKGSKRLTFYIDKNLVRRLHTYAFSEQAKERRAKNEYYKDHPSQCYLFLTKSGKAFMSAKREIAERQDPKSALNVNAPVFRQQTGDSHNMVFKEFVLKLRNLYPEVDHFAFHDLRATCGMEIVRQGHKKGLTETQIKAQVQTILGHTPGSAATDGYLNYDEFFQNAHSLAEEVVKDRLGPYVDPDKMFGSSNDGGE